MRAVHLGCLAPGGQARPAEGWVGATGSWGPCISQSLLLVLRSGCSIGELSRKVADGDLPTPAWIASPATHKLWQGRVVCPLDPASVSPPLRSSARAFLPCLSSLHSYLKWPWFALFFKKKKKQKTFIPVLS